MHAYISFFENICLCVGEKIKTLPHTQTHTYVLKSIPIYASTTHTLSHAHTRTLTHSQQIYRPSYAHATRHIRTLNHTRAHAHIRKNEQHASVQWHAYDIHTHYKRARASTQTYTRKHTPANAQNTQQTK